MYVYTEATRHVVINPSSLIELLLEKMDATPSLHPLTNKTICICYAGQTGQTK